jgi:CheY-like chemotaxis protein
MNLASGIEASSDGHSEPQTGLRILVVEDNEDCALSTAALLRMNGHEAVTAMDGEEALELARRFQPEVVLIDIGLPGMSGYVFARKLTGNRRQNFPLLIAVTGYAQEKDRRGSRAAGMHLHLVKPIDPNELEVKLRRFERALRSTEANNGNGAGAAVSRIAR